MTQILSGKKAICGFMGRSWTTVETLILHEGFPAKKIMGIWESSAELITAWRNGRIAAEVKLAKKRGNPNFIRKSTIEPKT